MKNKNTDLIAYGSYDIYIGRFLCLAYTIIMKETNFPMQNNISRLGPKIVPR